jgi:hypothetical protein
MFSKILNKLVAKLKPYLVHLSILAVDCGNEKIVADVCQVTPETKNLLKRKEVCASGAMEKRNNFFNLERMISWIYLNLSQGPAAEM